MNDDMLPPPFVVGQKYFDRNREYLVTATVDHQVAIERPDGRRTIEDAALKAQIHRNVVMERDPDLGTDRASRSKKRKKPTRRTQRMMDRILHLEADGADHSGVEIPLDQPEFVIGAVKEVLTTSTSASSRAPAGSP